jgi:methylated-DNA-[protein]-cysteine S-methyltransferase
MFIYAFETKLGWVAIAGPEGKISRMNLPMPSRQAAVESIQEGNKREFVETDRDFSGEAERIAAYFAGERVQFQCELDVPHAGDFDRRVWAAAREIPYGEVETYGSIAERIGRPLAARAVGQALGRNPVPVLVPCHRVLRRSGGLGGFGCGLEWKAKLLDLEKAVR